jgi:hypothetical protein
VERMIPMWMWLPVLIVGNFMLFAEICDMAYRRWKRYRNRLTKRDMRDIRRLLDPDDQS